MAGEKVNGLGQVHCRSAGGSLDGLCGCGLSIKHLPQGYPEKELDKGLKGKSLTGDLWAVLGPRGGNTGSPSKADPRRHRCTGPRRNMLHVCFSEMDFFFFSEMDTDAQRGKQQARDLPAGTL